MVRQVQPLRISKSTPTVSPSKSQSQRGSSNSTITANASPRPLSEIGNTEARRNSPSYNQATRVGPAIPRLGLFTDQISRR